MTTHQQHLKLPCFQGMLQSEFGGDRRSRLKVQRAVHKSSFCQHRVKSTRMYNESSPVGQLHLPRSICTLIA